MSLHHREKHGTLKVSNQALSTSLPSFSCKRRVLLYIVLVCFCEAERRIMAKTTAKFRFHYKFLKRSNFHGFNRVGWLDRG